MIKLKGHHKSGLFGLGAAEDGDEGQSLYGLGGPGPVLGPGGMVNMLPSSAGGTGGKKGRQQKQQMLLSPMLRNQALVISTAVQEKAIEEEADKTLAAIKMASLKMCNWMNNKEIVKDMAEDYEDYKARMESGALVVGKLKEWFKGYDHRVGALILWIPRLYDMIVSMRKSVKMGPFGDYTKEPCAFWSHPDCTPYKHYGGSNSLWWRSIKMSKVDGGVLGFSTPKHMSMFWGLGSETELAKAPDWYLGLDETFNPPGKLSGKVVKDNSLSGMVTRIKAWEKYYEDTKALNPLNFPTGWPEWIVKARKQKVPHSWEMIMDTAMVYAGGHFKTLVQKKQVALAQAGNQLESMRVGALAAMDALEGGGPTGNFSKWLQGSYMGAGAADFKLAMEAAEACHSKDMALYSSKMAAKLAAEVKKAKEHIQQQNAYREGIKAKVLDLEDQVQKLEAEQQEILADWDGKGDMPDKIYDAWEALNKQIKGILKQIEAYEGEVEGLIEYLVDKRTDLVLKRKAVVDAIKKAKEAKNNYDNSDPKDKDPETDAEMDGVDDSLEDSKSEVEDAGAAVIEIGDSMLDTIEKLGIDVPDLIVKIKKNSNQAQKNIDDLNPVETKAQVPWLTIGAVGLGIAGVIPAGIAAAAAAGGLLLYTKATEE